MSDALAYTPKRGVAQRATCDTTNCVGRELGDSGDSIVNRLNMEPEFVLQDLCRGALALAMQSFCC